VFTEPLLSNGRLSGSNISPFRCHVTIFRLDSVCVCVCVCVYPFFISLRFVKLLRAFSVHGYDCADSDPSKCDIM
jgi:hypothetical protein